MADHEIGGDAENVHNSDVDQLQRLGFKQQFIRTIGALDSFASSFCASNFVGSVRLILFLGILAGGPLAMWSSFLVNGVTVCLSCAILAEICSALPISGSVYIWAAAAAGVKYGRFVGFIVAWWNATAWTTFVAAVAEGVTLYIVSLITVFDLPFPGGVSNDNVRWRALLWIVSEGILLLSAAITYLPPRWYSMVFRGAMVFILFDFFLCLVWLPIGASRTYGLRTAREAFLTTYNGTGATPGWNWMLSFFFTSSILVGFDVAGHIAEETRNARTVAGRSILRSAIATSVGGFATIVLFLFCTPTIEALFSLSAPQPFVLIYSMALGRGGAVVMTVIAVLGAISSIPIVILAASRIIFAIARDGTLPLSSWVGEVTPDGRPQNAMLVTYGVAAILLCPIIGSSAAFTSLLSCGVVPIIATYGLIVLLRLTVTPNEFRDTEFSLGRARKILCGISALANAIIVMVLVSPFTFPVTAVNMNFGGIIFGVITIFGIISYWLTPEDRWLSQEKIRKMLDGASQLSDLRELEVAEILSASNEVSDSRDKK